MRCLKVVLEQSSANYRKPETVDNIQTYPLPPISTVVGAIHNACDWKDYHKMKIAVQGTYEAQYSKVQRHKVILNNFMRDRGYAVKMPAHNVISVNAGILIAKPEAGVFGRNIQTGKGYVVLRPDLIAEYYNIVAEIKKLTAAARNASKKEKIELLKKKEQLRQQKECFRSYESIPYHIDVLYGVRLVLYMQSKYDEEILDHIYDLKCIGRSSDTVNVISAEIIDCSPAQTGMSITASAYIPKAFAKNFGAEGGTVYYLNEFYKIIDGKRIFNKIPCLYASDLMLKIENENIFADGDNAFCFCN